MKEHRTKHAITLDGTDVYGGKIMLKNILKKNRTPFLLSLIPVVIVGVMAPLRSYIMQLLIDSSDRRELLERCLLAAVFSLGVFLFEWGSKKKICGI